jgi:hypothetical protein
MPTKTANAVKRAISIRQPWAEQILQGKKKREYRSRATNIRERVYLYASATRDPSLTQSQRLRLRADDLPTGMLVGTVEIVECVKMASRRYAYKLRDPRRLPAPVKPHNHPQPMFWRPELPRAARRLPGSRKEQAPMTPNELLRRIRRLPTHAPITDSFERSLVAEGIWTHDRARYESQKEHWVGWLKDYDSPGYYKRKVWRDRTAKYVYQHINCPPMLLWLAEAADVPRGKVLAAKRSAVAAGPALPSKAAAIRRVIPFSEIADCL